MLRAGWRRWFRRPPLRHQRAGPRAARWLGGAEVGPEIIYGLIGDYFADIDAFSRIQGGVLQLGAEVMTAILKRAADRGEAHSNIPTRVATLPTDLFRNELFRARTPPSESVLAEIVDEVFLPLVRP